MKPQLKKTQIKGHGTLHNNFPSLGNYMLTALPHDQDYVLIHDGLNSSFYHPHLQILKYQTVIIYVILTVPDAQNVFRYHKEDVVVEFQTIFTQPLELRYQKICNICTWLVCFHPCPLRAFTEISFLNTLSAKAQGSLTFTVQTHRMSDYNQPGAQFPNP